MYVGAYYVQVSSRAQVTVNSLFNLSMSVVFGKINHEVTIVKSKIDREDGENIWKVCLFYGQNNKIVGSSNMADTFIEKFMRCAKVCGLFFMVVFFGCWLAGQTNSDHMVSGTDLEILVHRKALNNNGYDQKMSQRYFCPAEYTTKTKPKTNQKR